MARKKNVQAIETPEVLNDYYALVSVDDLLEHPQNPRKGDIDAITASIINNGFYGAVVAQKTTKRILAGNHRWKAARAAGLKSVPVLWTDVDDATAVRILLADNRTNDLAGYDDEALLALLEECRNEDNLIGTGYSDQDIEDLLTAVMAEALPSVDEDEPDGIVSEPPADPITKAGDIWELGPHKVMCGDARNAAHVKKLLDKALINLAFTSPPYASQRKYDETSGFKPIHPDDYVDWFEDVQANVRAHLADDGSWFVNIKEHTDDGHKSLYVKDLTIAHVRQWAWRFVDELCWNRGSFPGQFPDKFKNGWEPVFHFAAGSIKFRPDAVAIESRGAFTYEQGRNITLNADGYSEKAATVLESGLARPSNVLTLGGGGDGTHSAAFPVALPHWFINAYTDLGDTVYDPFMGSGSTLIAAENGGRVAFGMEISPAYCDVILRRYQDLTGVIPTRNGKAFDFNLAMMR